MGEEQRSIVWELHHDNGWTTTVAQFQGTFVAYTESARACEIAYRGDTFEDACAAVLERLAHTTGHERCSIDCSEWALRFRRPERRGTTPPRNH